MIVIISTGEDQLSCGHLKYKIHFIENSNYETILNKYKKIISYVSDKIRSTHDQWWSNIVNRSSSKQKESLTIPCLAALWPGWYRDKMSREINFNKILACTYYLHPNYKPSTVFL